VRTTLTLDDDVASLLRREMRRSGDSLKAAVNHFLRLGLMSAGKQRNTPFVVAPRKLGLPPGLSYDCVAELLENLEEAANP
jgi:hypothetical protein